MSDTLWIVLGSIAYLIGLVTVWVMMMTSVGWPEAGPVDAETAAGTVLMAIPLAPIGLFILPLLGIGRLISMLDQRFHR